MKRSLIPVLVVAVLIVPGLSLAQRSVHRQAPAKALDSQVNSALANVQVVNGRFAWSVTRYNKGKNEIFSGENQCPAIELSDGLLVSQGCVSPRGVRVNSKTDQVFLRDASFASAGGKFQKLTPVFWTIPNHSGWSPYVFFRRANAKRDIDVATGYLYVTVVDLKNKSGTREFKTPAVKIGSKVYAHFDDNFPNKLLGRKILGASFGKIPLSEDVVVSANNSGWTIAHE